MAQIAAQPAAKRHYIDATCGGCGAGWTGITRCHCGQCHRLFSGITAFDAHRKAAGGKCLDPETLKKPQELVDGIWGYPLDEKGREYFESRRAAKAAG